MSVLRPEHKPPRPLPPPRATQNPLPRWANQSRSSSPRCAPLQTPPSLPPRSRNLDEPRTPLPLYPHLDTIIAGPLIYVPSVYCPIEGIVRLITDDRHTLTFFYRFLYSLPSGVPVLLPTGPNLTAKEITFSSLCVGGPNSTHPFATPRRPLPCYLPYHRFHLELH